MAKLLADVLVAAEDEHRVESRGGAPCEADVPLAQLVTVLGDHVGEELRAARAARG